MIYFPETINTVSIRNTISPIYFHSSFPSCAHYSLCACWHPEAVEESSSLTSCRLLILSRPVTSFSFPCLGSTDAPYSRHGGPGPLFPRWRPQFTGSAHPPSPGSGTPPFVLTAVFSFNVISCQRFLLFDVWSKLKIFIFYRFSHSPFFHSMFCPTRHLFF